VVIKTSAEIQQAFHNHNFVIEKSSTKKKSQYNAKAMKAEFGPDIETPGFIKIT
jgi:hypothetical protein